MKPITGVIVGAVVVLVAITGVLWYQNNQKPDNSGTLYIGITDAAADISNVNDIELSIKKVEVHSATEGWVSAASDTKSYKLLALNASGKTELYAKATVAAGTYDKVRVTLGDVVVKTKTKGDVKATLPSSYVVINTAVKVKKNANTSVKLDVLADQSLHATTDGKYIFAPVVKSESRSDATVSVASDNVVTTSGGTVDADVSVGVDFDGTSKKDFRLVTDNTLKVDSSVGSAVKFILGGKTYQQSDVYGEAAGTVNGSGSVQGSLNTGTNVNVNSGTSTKSDGSVNVKVNGGVNVGL